MPKFKPCPYCGAALDFGEKCDCRAEKKEKSEAESGIGQNVEGIKCEASNFSGGIYAYN